MGLDLTEIKDYNAFKVKYSKRLLDNSDYDDKTHCRQWARSVRGGYGQMRIDYETLSGVKKCKTTSPHQVSFMLANDKLNLEPGLEISHLCGNKLCLAESHLWAETHKINLSRVHCHTQRLCRDINGNPHVPPCTFM